MRFLLNTIVSALLIAGAAELGKRSSLAGALLIALPTSSVLALTFLYAETKDVQRVAALSTSIFWLVLPTLLFFLALPALLRAGWGFWAALAASSVAMVAVFWIYSWVLERAGVRL